MSVQKYKLDYFDLVSYVLCQNYHRNLFSENQNSTCKYICIIVMAFAKQPSSYKHNLLI